MFTVVLLTQNLTLARHTELHLSMYSIRNIITSTSLCHLCQISLFIKVRMDLIITVCVKSMFAPNKIASNTKTI